MRLLDSFNRSIIPLTRPRWLSRLGSFARGEHGTAAIEFAMIAPVLLLIAFASIEFNRAYAAQSYIAAAVREGGRYAGGATANPSVSPTLDSVRIRVRNATPAFMRTGSDSLPLDSIFVTDPANPASNGRAVVTIRNYQYRGITPLWRLIQAVQRSSGAASISRSAAFMWEQ